MKTKILSMLAVLVSSVTFAASVVGPNTTITFKPGSAVLTAESKIQLQNFVKHSKEAGKINEMKVAAWSDNPAPKDGEELSKLDRDLAAKRVANIQDYLKDLNVAKAETYNMAERASWLARAFHTDAAVLKEELSKDSVTKDEFQVFKNNGEPSRAVVLTLLKRSNAD